MDLHTLECLDFYRVRELLSSFAMTSLGKQLALSIEPTVRDELVKRWLTQVREMLRLWEERGAPPYGGITDVREVVRRCAPPLRVSADEMAQVGATLRGTRAIAAHLANLPEGSDELKHLAERVGDFSTVADRISAVIDERGQVRDDASPKLSRIRGEIAEAHAGIREVVERLLRDPDMRRLLQYANHTFHQDRMVLPVRTEYRGRVPGIIHRSSDSGATIYVEPAAAVELNNRVTHLRAEEHEEIARLLWELAHEVYINHEPILRTLDTLAVLDLIVAKVRFAKAFDLRCPEISEAALLRVRRARHPILLELLRQRREAGEAVEEVVPIDYRLGDDFQMLIITGPNTGGKTVTLKTVGLLSLMVQAGMPAPVGEGSVFGVFRHVLIDIGDEQSMQQSLSTFSAHLTRQLDMLRRAGPRTLILLDELGAGTDPDEGGAIGRAILDELLKLECRCIATTHIGALKSYALTRPRCENACVAFDDVSLRPRYTLTIGEPGMSNAIHIAQRLGMPKRLVAAAQRNLSRRAQALHSVMEGATQAKRRAEAARSAAEDARLAADRALVDADSVRKKLEQQQTDFHAWVRRVVHLQPGDAVRVRNFDRDGRIVRIRLDQQRAEVDVGAFTVEVPLGDVLPPETPAPPGRPPLPMVPRSLQDQRPHKPRRRTDGEGPARDARPPARSGQGGRDGPGRGARTGEGGQGRERAPGHERGRGRDDHRQHEAERAHYLPLSDAEAATLESGASIYVKRFHRVGRVVRVNAAKKVASVNVGLLEVEVPFGGLAKLPPPEPARPRPAKPKTPAAVSHVDAKSAPAAAEVVSDAAGDAALRGAAADAEPSGAVLAEAEALAANDATGTSALAESAETPGSDGASDVPQA